MAQPTSRRPVGKGNIKKGVCKNNNYLNPDTGETGDCPKCASGEVQAVNVVRLSDFKCSVCGQRLTKIEDPWWKKALKYGVPAAIIIGGGLAFMGGDEEVVTPPPTEEAKIDVAPATVSDTVGKTVALSATVSPVDARIAWASSDDKVATVDSNGVVTLLKQGEVTITGALNDSVNAISKITVVEKKAETTPNEPKNVLGGAASISGSTITFHRGYSLDLHTFDGERLYISRGDRIIEAKIQNGRLMSGILVTTTGEERYLSGLNSAL